jgi:hypothetical protein
VSRSSRDRPPLGRPGGRDLGEGRVARPAQHSVRKWREQPGRRCCDVDLLTGRFAVTGDSQLHGGAEALGVQPPVQMRIEQHPVACAVQLRSDLVERVTHGRHRGEADNGRGGCLGEPCAGVVLGGDSGLERGNTITHPIEDSERVRDRLLDLAGQSVLRGQPCNSCLCVRSGGGLVPVCAAS